MTDFTFTSPEGKSYTVSGPEGATPAQAFEVLQQQLGTQPAAAQEAPSEPITASGLAKAAGVGVGEGAINLAGAPADLANLAAKGADYLAGSNLQRFTQPIANYAGGNALQGYIERATGPFYKPKNLAESVVNTVGQFAPAMVGGPEGLINRAITRAIIPGTASELAGQATAGTPLEPYARVAGAVLGAGAPVAASRVVSPATINPERQAAVDLFNAKGIPTDAAMQTGNKALGYLHSELGDALGAGQKATASNESTLKAFTSAAIKDAGAAGTDFTPATVNANLADMKNGFNAVAAKYTPENPIQLADGLKPKVDEIIAHFEDNQGHPPNIIKGFLKRLGFDTSATPELPAGMSEKARQQVLAQLAGKDKGAPAITGKQYQSVSSDIATALRGATNPDLKFALGKFKSALDEAVMPGLAEADRGVWQQLRARWLNHLILEDAVKSSTETAAQGLITPAKLEQSIQKFTKTGYTRGTSPLAPLARAGNLLMKSLPQSGTAPRAAARGVPAIAGAIVGGHFGLLPGIVAGFAGPAAMGRAIYSRPAQAYLRNQKAVALRQEPFTRKAITSGLLGVLTAQR